MESAQTLLHAYKHLVVWEELAPGHNAFMGRVSSDRLHN
jgi:hypothetical protein